MNGRRWQLVIWMVLAVIIVQSMSTEATPSVEFDLEDRQQDSDHPMLLDFSNTTHKPLSPHQHTPTLNKVLTFDPTPPTLSLQPNSLFQELDFHFARSFVQDESDGRDNQEQTRQEKEMMKNVRAMEIDVSFPPRRALLSILPSNDKTAKSETFSNNSFFPSFHIRKRGMKDRKYLGCENVLNHSNIVALEVENNSVLNKKVPKTCGMNRKAAASLVFTSKATPKDSEIAKRIIKKHGKDDNVFSVKAILKELRGSADEAFTIIQQSDKIRQLLHGNGRSILPEVISQRERTTIFKRLPSIR